MSETSFSDFLSEFKRLIETTADRLARESEAAASVQPRPDAWSPKEILGHLVDSACNNHRRIVLAQTQDDLVFPGYDQDTWVRLQRYRDVDWRGLVAFWRSYNLHIAHAMESAPDDERRRPRHPHSLESIAYITVASTRHTTLEYLMRDYVNHLRHHVDEILRQFSS
jgi:hypothetical protein